MNTFTQIYLASASLAVRNNPDLAQYLRLAVSDRRRRWDGDDELPAGAIGGTVRNVLDDNVDSISGLEDALGVFIAESEEGREGEIFHELSFEITSALAAWYEAEISRPEPEPADHTYSVGDLVFWRSSDGAAYLARVLEDDPKSPHAQVKFLSGPDALVRPRSLGVVRARITPIPKEA